MTAIGWFVIVAVVCILACNKLRKWGEDDATYLPDDSEIVSGWAWGHPWDDPDDRS